MSDQPGIPAFTVFPPFNPAPRQSEPAPEPPRDQAPAEPETPAAAEAPAPEPLWDAPAPPEPAPWDFEAPAAPRDEEAAPPAMMDDEDLPWLEVPEPRPAAGETEEIKAEDGPNWMDWVRSDEPAGEAPPAPEDAQPWAPEVENAADDWAGDAPADPWSTPDTPSEPWRAPVDEAPADPWRAPADELPAEEPWRAPADDAAPAGDPWSAPIEPAPAADAPDAAAGDFVAADTGLELPDEELYDLPEVPAAEPRAATPWADAEAPLFEPAADAGAEEPAWELPAQPSAAAPEPAAAWADEAPAAEAPAPAPAAHPDVSGAFGEVADQLQRIADALRQDPAAFLAGAQGGGDPLALLVAGFVLGYNARPRNS